MGQISPLPGDTHIFSFNLFPETEGPSNGVGTDFSSIHLAHFSLDPVCRVTGSNKRMPCQPAPGRKILRSTRISGYNLERLSRFHRAKSHAKFEHKVPASDVAGIPLGIAIWMTISGRCSFQVGLGARRHLFAASCRREWPEAVGEHVRLESFFPVSPQPSFVVARPLLDIGKDVIPQSISVRCHSSSEAIPCIEERP